MVTIKANARKSKMDKENGHTVVKKEVKIEKKRKTDETDVNEIKLEKKIKTEKPVEVEESAEEPVKAKNGVDHKKTAGKPVKRLENGKSFDKNGKKFKKAGQKNLDVVKGAGDKPEISYKDLKKQRRMKKLEGNYQIGVDIKKIWETLRKAETTDEVRQKLCRALHEQVKGKVKTMAFAHDTVRVIECLMKYGNENHRTTIFTELDGTLVDLSKSKYGRFLLIKMLKYGTKEQKDVVIEAFKGNAVKMIKHSFSCKVVETIFNEYANQSQRNQMLSEFYDLKSIILMDRAPKTLADVLKANEKSRETILENIKNVLTTCIDKSLLMFSLIHRVFYEYFQNCDQKMKSEMIEALGEHIIHLVHTRDGAEVAKQCIWFSTAKQRKAILKSLKSFICKIAKEEHGHLVLLAIFDSVDDTKLVSKIVLDELFRSVDELMDDEYGRKTIVYLLTPRDKKFFIKDYIRRLEGGDLSETSKKDKQIRYNELLQYSVKYLGEYLNKNLEKCLANGALSIILPQILSRLENPSEIFSKLANLLLEKEYEPVDKEEKGAVEHIVENSTTHLSFKHIFQNENEIESKNLSTLTETLLSHENASYLKSWCGCNRGCFLIITMIEKCKEETRQKIKKLLKNVNLAEHKFAGAKILTDKLNGIK